MTKIVRCTCGVEIRNGDEEQLIRDVQMHAREAHALSLNDEQVRAMMVIDQEGPPSVVGSRGAALFAPYCAHVREGG